VVNSSYEKPWSIKRDFREMACFHQKEQNLELPPTSGSSRVKARDNTCFQEEIMSQLQIQNGQKCKLLFKRPMKVKNNFTSYVLTGDVVYNEMRTCTELVLYIHYLTGKNKAIV